MECFVQVLIDTLSRYSSTGIETPGHENYPAMYKPLNIHGPSEAVIAEDREGEEQFTSIPDRSLCKLNNAKSGRCPHFRVSFLLNFDCISVFFWKILTDCLLYSLSRSLDESHDLQPSSSTFNVSHVPKTHPDTGRGGATVWSVISRCKRDIPISSGHAPNGLDWLVSKTTPQFCSSHPLQQCPCGDVRGWHE